MNREIKFRGQRIDNSEWVFGSYQNEPCANITFINSENQLDAAEIIPETVGQFTGLKDKNGMDIYEGDLVKWTNGKHYWEAVIRTLDDNKSNTLYAVETFCNLSTYFNEHDEECYSFERTDERKGCRNEIDFLSKTTEIIGNIHENPNLLRKSSTLTQN